MASCPCALVVALAYAYPDTVGEVRAWMGMTKTGVTAATAGVPTMTGVAAVTGQ